MASEKDSVRFYVFGRDNWANVVFTDTTNLVLGYESDVPLHSLYQGNVRLIKGSGRRSKVHEGLYALGETVQAAKFDLGEWMQYFPLHSAGEIIRAEELSGEHYLTICDQFESALKGHEAFVRGVDEEYGNELERLQAERSRVINEHVPNIEEIVRSVLS